MLIDYGKKTELVEEIDETNAGFTHRTIRPDSKEYRKSAAMYKVMVKAGIVQEFPESKKKEHKIIPYIKRDPSEYHRNKRYVSLGGRGRSMDVQGRMTVEQKEQFLIYISSCLSEGFALDKVGVNYNIFYKECELDPEFREVYKRKKRGAEGALEAIVADFALTNNDHEVALTLRNFQEKVKNQSIERSHRAREIKLKKQQVEAQVKAINHISGNPPTASFRNLTPEEVYTYEDLKLRLSVLSTDEKVLFAELTAKVIAPPPPDTPEQQLKQIENLDKYLEFDE